MACMRNCSLGLVVGCSVSLRPLWLDAEDKWKHDVPSSEQMSIAQGHEFESGFGQLFEKVCF